MRKQAEMTMRCMQALVRVQARVRAGRLQLANQNYDKRFAVEEEGWDGGVVSVEKMKEDCSRKRDAQMKREKALAYAYAYQVCLLFPYPSPVRLLHISNILTLVCTTATSTNTRRRNVTIG